MAWGLVLDAIGSYEVVTGLFHWRRPSIYFFALLVLNAIAFAYIPRLHESPTAGTPASVFYEGLKRLSRFWQR